MTDDDERDAAWRPDWGGPDPVAATPPPLFPSTDALTDPDTDLEAEPDRGADEDVGVDRGASVPSRDPSPWAQRSGAEPDADDPHDSIDERSPWARADGTAEPSSDLLAAIPASAAPSGRSSAAPTLTPAESPWSFPPVTDVGTGSDAGESEEHLAPMARPEFGIVEPEPRPDPGTDTGSTTGVVNSVRRRRGTPRALVGIGVVVALVAGLAIVRSLVGDGTERADGARLPAAIDERWSIPFDDRIVFDVAMTDDVVVVVSGRSRPGGVELAGHAAADGTELWSEALDAVSTQLSVVDDDLVVVSAIGDVVDGRFSFAFDPSDGTRRWERNDVSVVLTRPELGHVAIADSSQPPTFEPVLEFVDLVTGETIPPVGGRPVGLDIDGDVFALDEDGSVRRLAVSAIGADSSEIESTVVATTSPDRGNVFELAGRYFAPGDGVIVEIGFAADAGRVLLDRRPEDQQESPLPTIEASAFFLSVDDRHAVMVGIDGSMGIELEGDELRAIWSAGAFAELPRLVDGGRVVVEVVTETELEPTRSAIVDAMTGDVVAEFEGEALPLRVKPVDGTFTVDEAGAGRAAPGAPQAVVAVDLGGRALWTLEDVTAGPFLGDRVVVIARRDADDSALAFFDEGPRTRD